MNKHAGNLRNDSRAWIEVPADDNGDAMIAAMAEAGVEYIFFTSGSEIGFYQEAVAKAHANGRRAPKLITVTHEHASLNAALGYAAVSGKPAGSACPRASPNACRHWCARHWDGRSGSLRCRGSADGRRASATAPPCPPPR